MHGELPTWFLIFAWLFIYAPIWLPALVLALGAWWWKRRKRKASAEGRS